MKTYKNLYPRLCAFDNLFHAFRKARRGKRGRPDVAAFEHNLELELPRLQDELVAETYRPGRYRHFTIYEGKPRRISAAPFRDRVVHHALCNVIEPIWETRFIHDSYACRVGKGTHAALDRCTYFARRYRYVLQGDIVQFFPSVDHAILYQALARYIADSRTMRLIERIIASGRGIHAADYRMQWFPGDDLLAATRPRGLPIGNQTSQFWANVYLHAMDDFVKRTLRCPAYLRYCDDFLLFADDKPTLHRWRREIETFLVGLRLKLHPYKTVVYPVTNGIPFLGFLVFPDHRRLARSNGVRFQRRWRRLIAAYSAGQIDRQQVEASVRGWVAHAAHGDTYGLRRSLLAGAAIPRVGG
ncbi:MAG: reverse transcriptase domain-containing protein [Anaerolineae bacterium]